jgi:hypothetical protein
MRRHTPALTAAFVALFAVAPAAAQTADCNDVIGGLVAGVVVMILVMCGCCYGLYRQPAQTAASGDSRMPHFSKGCVCLWLCPIILLLLACIGTIVLFVLNKEYCWTHKFLMENPGYGHYFWAYYGGPLAWFPLNFFVVFMVWMFCCKAPKSDAAGPAMDAVAANPA